MIKYIGSKRRLLPQIVAAARALPGARTALDAFSGTSRVGHALKGAGFDVTANDFTHYGEVLARAHVEADLDRVDLPWLQATLARLQALAPAREPGWFTQTYCIDSRYVQVGNGLHVEAIREAIDDLARDDVERALLLTSLIEATDRVDSTTGVQMAYLKSWAPRSANDLELRVPAMLSGPGRAMRMDALDLPRSGDSWNIAYLDPPYNSHSYHGNYHLWQTLVQWDAPEVYGIARKRIDTRTNKSAFNSRPAAEAALAGLVAGLDAEWLLVSFNDEGHVSRAAIESMLGGSGRAVATVPVRQKRYVGAQIGIHSPSGERVGEVAHLVNTELLFVAGPDQMAVDVAADAARTAGDGAVTTPR